MPRECKAEMDKYTLLQALGGKVKWDYNKGEEYEATTNTR